MGSARRCWFVMSWFDVLNGLLLLFLSAGVWVYKENSGVDEDHDTTLTLQAFRGVTPSSDCVKKIEFPRIEYNK
jgi:hypothetical protein